MEYNNEGIVNSKITNPIIRLLDFNIVWHAHLLKNLMMRYKIFMLFIILLLAPNLDFLKHIITSPAANLIDLHGDYFAFMKSLFVYQLFGVIWIYLHKAAYDKNPWQKYLASLPLTTIQKVISETCMIFVSDFIILIPVFLVTYLEISKNYKYYSLIPLILEKCLLTINLILLVQIAFIKHKHKIMLFALLLDSILLCQRFLTNDRIATCIIFVLIIISFYLIYLCFADKLKIFKVMHANVYKVRTDNKINFKSIFPFTKIQIKNILLDNNSQIVLSISFLIAVFIISTFIMIYGSNNSYLNLLISTFMLINSLILSNLFEKLNSQRLLFSTYLNALPITKINTYSADMILLFSILSIINVSIILIGLHFSLNNNYIFCFCTTLITPTLFLSIAYLPQINYKRYGFFISLIIMSLFVWINYLLFQLTS